MTIAVSTLVDRCLQRVNPGKRDTLNVLTATLTNSATTFTLTYDIAGLGANARFSIGVEDILGLAVTTSTKTVDTAVRALGGSPSVQHATSQLVHVNPDFSTWDILNAFNEVLAILPGFGIYNFQSVSLTGSAIALGYNLTSVDNLLGVHEVRYKALGGQSDYVTVPRRLWTVRQKMPTGDFAAAEALFLYGHVDPGQTLQVLYKAPFTALAITADSDLATDVETQTGLPASMHALLYVGAALRLIQGRPIERSQTSAQGDTRRPQEVTTNDTRLAISPLELEWQRLVRAARREQIRKYGP